MSYADLLIWQYRGKPKATQSIKLIEQVIGSSFIDLRRLPDVLNIDTAIGDNLDIVGRHVGQLRILNGYQLRKFFGFKGSKHALGFSQKRIGGGEWYRRRDPLADAVRLGDEDYRFLIKCRILKNYQQGTIPDIIQACEFVFGSNCVVEDNYNMTVSVTIPKNNLNNFKTFAINNLDILPRQAGVKYLFTIR